MVRWFADPSLPTCGEDEDLPTTVSFRSGPSYSLIPPALPSKNSAWIGADNFARNYVPSRRDGVLKRPTHAEGARLIPKVCVDGGAMIRLLFACPDHLTLTCRLLEILARAISPQLAHQSVPDVGLEHATPYRSSFTENAGIPVGRGAVGSLRVVTVTTRWAMLASALPLSRTQKSMISGVPKDPARRVCFRARYRMHESGYPPWRQNQAGPDALPVTEHELFQNDSSGLRACCAFGHRYRIRRDERRVNLTRDYPQLPCMFAHKIAGCHRLADRSCG